MKGRRNLQKTSTGPNRGGFLTQSNKNSQIKNKKAKTTCNHDGREKLTKVRFRQAVGRTSC